MNEAGNSPQQPPVPAGPPQGPPPETGEPGASPGHDPRAAAAPPPRARDLINDHTPGGGGGTGPSDAEPDFGGGRGGEPAGGANPMRNSGGPNAAKSPGGSAAEDGGAGPAKKAGGLAGAKNLPSKPQGDNLKEKGAHAAGQAADQAARKYANSMGVPNKAYDLGKKALASKAGQAMLNKTPAGKLLSKTRLGKSFKDGFMGDADKKKKGRKGEEKADASGSGSGSGKGKVLIAGSAGVLPLVLLMLLPMALGAAMDDNAPSQPDDRSNSVVAKYFPDRWQQVLQQSADRASSGGESDYATVPWTVLAGIVATQTDFARYSPYDSVDRDPGRTAPEITPGGGSGGPDDTTIGDPSGAGPGPISGVGGSGESASAAPGHPGPPPGDLSHQLGWFLWAMRMHESSGNYKAGSRGAACGAYQYMPGTWNNYQGYPTACDAPPSVQDKRAIHDFLVLWKKFHMWQSVAIKHFTGSDEWARSPEKWDSCPAACNVNPTGWGYVDDVMQKMAEAAKKAPAAGAQPAAFPMGPNVTVRPADMGPHAVTVSAGRSTVAAASVADLKAVTAAADLYGATGAADRTDAGEGVLADGCAVGNPSPSIGGKGTQGSGPYLLTPSAAGDMRTMGLDPQNPCDSSFYVARKLSDAAKQVHSDPSSPRWVADGSPNDQENARKYWSKAIEVSGIFMDRTAKPDAPCALPPPDDPKKPWSISFKIISIWHCQVTRMPELYLVTGAQNVNDKFTYTVEQSRSAAEQTLINEAMAVSYAGSGWKTDKCDDKSKDRQGIFPMTPEEAAKAGVTDRCDAEKNIEGAAKLVLAGEKVPPEKRDKKKGDFQPMVGGWQSLSIAMGKDLDIFSAVGPGTSFVASDACTKVMTAYLNKIAPLATEFTALLDPPDQKDLGTWQQKLSALESKNKIGDPGSDPACVVGSWAPGFNGELAQLAAGLAGADASITNNLTGLGNYYQAADGSVKPTDPVVGQDPLVIPRLAPRPFNQIDAPVAADATDAWSRIGTSDGVTLPLSQVAIDYAWFFGGVVSPFDSAGKLIGSLANGSAGGAGDGPTQQTVGPDGCPENAPSNTLLGGSDKIGIHKLCVDSVAQARTPQAAMAVKWALTSLGWPYTQNIPARTTGKSADCSSFVSRAYRDSGAIPNLFHGNAPITTTFREVPWGHQIPFSEAKPGDLVEPESGHVVMHLADGYNVQESTWGEVSHVKREYSSAFWTGWIDASKV
ncbi:C40 family peptidase [Actinoallomurus purpureus]|uniref:C40 family peptidase n=1 Tax=Actinoallomurus purpureus TaxID=478114 RepID=UPI002092AB6C|nr:C40 family peptidase [Actinoallomurus purpureus]MCO6009160.1 C40 family peptidase [Actinoallomurus purpureus]